MVLQSLDVGSIRAGAATLGDSFVVSGVFTEGEEGCSHACGGESNATGRGSSGSATSLGGSCSKGQDRREALCLAGTGGDSCSRRERFEW